MNLTDAEKRKAIEAAKAIQEAAKAERLEAITETRDEVDTGSPRTPDHEADYGQTMKPAQGSEGKSLAESQPLESKTAEFDKWLAAAQEQVDEHKESKAHDKGNDLDR